MLVTRPRDGCLRDSVYLKPTHSDKYPNANLYNIPCQKHSMVNALILRAIALSQFENLQIELRNVSSSLLSNIYRNQDIVGTIKRLNPRPLTENIDGLKSVVFLLYINGVADLIFKQK